MLKCQCEHTVHLLLAKILMLQKASKSLQAQSSVVFGLLAIFDKYSGRISVVFFIVVWMRGVTHRLMCLNTHNLQSVTLFWTVVESLSGATLLKEGGHCRRS